MLSQMIMINYSGKKFYTNIHAEKKAEPSPKVFVWIQL